MGGTTCGVSPWQKSVVHPLEVVVAVVVAVDVMTVVTRNNP